MPTVLIADDHPLFRKALRGVLRMACADFTVIEAGSLAEVRQRINDDHDLALLDLAMPDAAGFEALLALRRLAPAVPVIVVSAFVDGGTVRNAAIYGAAGFIPKTADPATIMTAIRSVLAGGRWWPAAVASGAMPALEPGVEGDTAAGSESARHLSKCESRVLALLVEGKSNKVIAHDLGIKESTVKSHITSLLRKLGVHSRTQAALLAKGMPA